MLDLIPCGTEITTKAGRIEGFITAIKIRFDSVLYEVTYYIDGDLKTAYMHENEFTCKVKERASIGYIKSPAPTEKPSATNSTVYPLAGNGTLLTMQTDPKSIKEFTIEDQFGVDLDGNLFCYTNGAWACQNRKVNILIDIVLASEIYSNNQ